MAFSIRRKKSQTPQTPAAVASTLPPAPTQPSVSAAAAEAAWREKLTAARPKGRFTQGELVSGSRRR